MPITEKEIVDKKLIKDRVDNYPDLEGMVAAGLLSYKSGWYEAKSKEAHDAIVHSIYHFDQSEQRRKRADQSSAAKQKAKGTR